MADYCLYTPPYSLRLPPSKCSRFKDIGDKVAGTVSVRGFTSSRQI
jgi:hypothetical protein